MSSLFNEHHLTISRFYMRACNYNGSAIPGVIRQQRLQLLTGAPPRLRLVDYSGGPPSKGWILAQMEEHWYVNPGLGFKSQSSQIFFANFSNCLNVPINFFPRLFDLKEK